MAANVVFGAGQLGLAVARRLVASGEKVRLVNRSGKAPAPEGAEVMAADATDPADAMRACHRAAVVYHCATGPYGRWAQFLPPLMNGIIEGAAGARARLVYGDNLYAYGIVDGPIREDLPYRPVGPNTRIRAELATMLMNAHASGKVRATIGRGSDFYGPFARLSKAGDSIFGRAIAGRPAQVVGSADVPHTYTFIDDFAAGLVTLGRRDEALGQVWHIPNADTVTTRRFIEMVYEHLGVSPRLTVAPRFLIDVLGLFVPSMAAVKETMYQSDRPWVVDHGKFARAFGAEPTPLDQAIAQTIAWFKG